MSMITLTEASERLGLKQNDTIYRWEKEGKIEITRKSGKVRLVSEDIVEKIKREREDKVVPRGMRKCTFCGFLGEFEKFAKGRNRCLECHVKMEIERYHKDKDKHRENRLAYSDRNRDHINKKAKVWYENNYDKAKLRITLKRYGLSEEEYREMLNKVNYRCEICKQDLKKPCIDHDHGLEGKNSVRGILCHTCNSCLGYMKDNIDYLENAIIYLKNSKSKILSSENGDGV